MARPGSKPRVGPRGGFVGLDSTWSWFVTVAAAWIHFWNSVLFRSSGVLFIAIVNVLGVSYGDASWPFSLINTLYQLMGPITGVLIVRGYVRSISLLGTVLCVLASFLCFLNFNYISLLFFVPMAGIGQGLCTPVNTILVNQFFDRHLSTASGISLTGITLASFVFPPAVTILLQTYGLRGTFLIISGLTLHAVAGALAIRPPPWMFKRSAPKTTHHENDVVSSSCPNVESEEMLSRDEAPLEEEEQALTQLGDMSSMSMDVSAANVVMFSEADSDEDGEEKEPLKRRPSDDEIIVYELQRRQQNPVYQPTVVTLPRSSVLQLAFTRKPSWTKRIHFFKKPFYYLILAHWISSSYVNFCFMVSLVDMAIGKGAQPTAAAMVLSAYSSGDLAGRLLSGWISDRGFLTREGVMTLNCAILSAVLFVVPSCDSYASLVVVTVVVGWCIGSCVILFAVLLSKVSGLENLSLAIGTTTFFMGIATLARPTLIAHFKDVKGSYDGLYTLHGVVFGALFLIYFSTYLYRRLRKGKSDEATA